MNYLGFLFRSLCVIACVVFIKGIIQAMNNEDFISLFAFVGLEIAVCALFSAVNSRSQGRIRRRYGKTTKKSRKTNYRRSA